MRATTWIHSSTFHGQVASIIRRRGHLWSSPARTSQMPAHPCATRLLPLVLAAMSGLALLQAHAASSDADIVVTGTRLPMTSSGLAQNVTVIEHAEILASNPSGIEDVLSRV